MDVVGVTETASPNASSVVSGAEAYNVHGGMDVSMGDMMQDNYNPKRSSPHPASIQHPSIDRFS